MFWIKFQMDGIEYKCDTLAASAADLHEPLARFMGYMRKKAHAKYERQNFAPLADSTMKKREERGRHSLERKLARDVRRAQKRAGGGRKGDVLADVLAVQTRGMKNRLAVLAEFQRRHPKMFEGRKNGIVADALHLKPLTAKQVESLDARQTRAIERAKARPILGGLPRTLVIQIGNGSGTLVSRTHEEWSEAQNSGATVGHGAQLPERKTIELESVDIHVFESILKDHLLKPFQEGLQGPGY